MNLSDLTRFFRGRKKSVFLELSAKFTTMPSLSPDAVLCLFFFMYKLFHRLMPSEQEMEELKLFLAGALPLADADELTENARQNAVSGQVEDAAKSLAQAPIKDRLQLAAAMLELDKTYSPLSPEIAKIFSELAAAMGIYPRRIQEILTLDAKRRNIGSKMLNSGAGLAVALVVIVIFLLAATFLKSLIFGIILAYFFLPLEKYFEKHFFQYRIVAGISNVCNFCMTPFQKLTAIFAGSSPLNPSELELARRKSLVLKSSVATLVSVILGALLFFTVAISILIPAALNTGRSINNWANSSPLLGHFEKVISSWIKSHPAQTPEDAALHGNEQGAKGSAKPEVLSIRDFFEWLRPALNEYIQTNSKQLASVAFMKSKGILSTLLSIATSLGTFIFDILLFTFFFLYFLQKMALFSNSFRAAASESGETIGDWSVKSIFDSNWLPATSENSRKEAAEIINRICLMFDSWTKGYILIILVESTLYITAFSIFSVPYALPLGLIAGLTILLPFIGPVASFILTFLICLTFCDVNLAITLIGVGGTYLIINGILEQLILYPSLVGGAIGLTTIETIIVVLLGGLFAGITGMIFAVPAAAVIKYLIPKIYGVWSNGKKIG